MRLFDDRKASILMTKQAVKHPEKTVSTGKYSAGIICDGWLYVSGHASQDLNTGDVISGSVGEETSRTLASIGKVLDQAGCTFDDIVKCTVYVTDRADWQPMNEVYFANFSRDPPHRVSCIVSGLGSSECLVEIDATAFLG